MNIMPCKICLELGESEICIPCKCDGLIDYSPLNDICAICQSLVEKYAFHLDCCGHMIHTHCSIRLTEFCQNCATNVVTKCPYCNRDHDHDD